MGKALTGDRQMNTATKTATTLAAILGIAILASAPTTQTAEAGKKGAVAAGIIAGAIIGTGLAHSAHRHRAHRGPVVVYKRPARRGRITPAGVSVRHANWCASRYRSYDWNTNTFVTYGGQVRYCR